MNSSVQPSRRIASNLLWTAEGLVRNPLVTLAADGRILCVATCEAPDREACVEFYAGVLVPGFPADVRSAFEELLAHKEVPLLELLAALLAVDTPGATLVVISGLDYHTMHLTAVSCIQKI